MKISLPGLVVVSLLLGLAPLRLLGASPQAATPGSPLAEGAAAGSGGAVVLELFTSQGCSTCPPAEDLLARLAREPQWQGRLVPLELHVDYWNRLGWRDPFSSRDWSERQRQYEVALGKPSVYTPQLVVNGHWECVGSVEGDVRALLAAAAAETAGRLTLHIRNEGPKLAVEVEAAPPPGRERRLDLMVAVFENGLETGVERGENARRTLREDFVLRHLERAFVVRGAARRESVALRLEREWNVERLGVAAFLQDPATRAIVAAASAAVPR